jgi:hypothetical protein
MTVKDLIEQLQMLPPYYPIVVDVDLDVITGAMTRNLNSKIGPVAVICTSGDSLREQQPW